MCDALVTVEVAWFTSSQHLLSCGVYQVFISDCSITLCLAHSCDMCGGSLHRCDAKRQRYVGAVCGLGCDPMTGQSLYSDHDIELIFDTLITQDDLDLVRS